MSTTVAVNPELIRWAVERSGLTREDLGPFSVVEWENGEKQPTLHELEGFAKRTKTPFGYLFLSAPPEEPLPMPDFRTVGDSPIRRPSPNLIETVQTMQRRQAWMRDDLIEQGHAGLSFVGSLNRHVPIETAAEQIRKTLELSEDWTSQHSTWGAALRALRNAAENIGILVAVNGVVGLNAHRSLDPEEFRGFVLCDALAPLIFVNGADAKSAQMFTLAHELAHLWLGYSGLFNLIEMRPHNDQGEQYCDRVAAEFLVPAKKLAARWAEASETETRYTTLANWFKVSPLVVARRALDLKLINKAAFFVFYQQQREQWEELKEEKKKKEEPSRGDFYRTVNVRLGYRFGSAVICAAREGRLPYRDAYQLTGLYGATFDKYANRLIERMRNG
jgi:Zn-dependent peptidase ImmA (M78 family)